VAPTRLLRLDPEGSEFRVQLVEPKNITLGYAALSHCWGKVQPLKTTQFNLKAHLNGIHFGDLPCLFQDATRVTHSLGLHYLWIDSLCIIQDSKEDWEEQCTRMADIYRDAAVTISAADARDSSISFLLLRQSSELNAEKVIQLEGNGLLDCDVRLKYPTNDVGHTPGIDTSLTSTSGRALQERSLSRRVLSLTKGQSLPRGFGLPECDIQVEYSTDDARHTPGTDTSLISTRGWVLQEQLLSGRVLSFTEDRMTWECNTTCISDDLNHHYDIGPLTNRIVRKLVQDDLQNSDKIYKYWEGIIESYSCRQLSRKVDKLPAVSGLARAVSAVLNDDYLAGLWKRDLSYSLCWSTFDHGGGCMHLDGHHSVSRKAAPSSYRAPSWSWASVDAPVYYDKLLGRCQVPELGVTAAYTKVKSKDPFGEVEDGSLVVHGLLRPCKFVIVEFQEPSTFACLYSPNSVQMIRSSSAELEQAENFGLMLSAFTAQDSSPLAQPLNGVGENDKANSNLLGQGSVSEMREGHDRDDGGSETSSTVPNSSPLEGGSINERKEDRESAHGYQGCSDENDNIDEDDNSDENGSEYLVLQGSASSRAACDRSRALAADNHRICGGYIDSQDAADRLAAVLANDGAIHALLLSRSKDRQNWTGLALEKFTEPDGSEKFRRLALLRSFGEDHAGYGWFDDQERRTIEII
jgi:hypothetical protein